MRNHIQRITASLALCSIVAACYLVYRFVLWLYGLLCSSYPHFCYSFIVPLALLISLNCLSCSRIVKREFAGHKNHPSDVTQTRAHTQL